MTAASTDPQQSDTEREQPETEPEQTGAEPAEDDAPRSRRRPPLWLLVAAGLLVVVAVVTFTRDTGTTAPDLSTPEGAARAFAQSAAVGDVDGVIAVTCLGDDGCAAEHGDGVTDDQLRAAKKVIADNVHEIGNLFARVRFTSARPGAEPGTQEVDYRLPGMRARNYLVFVEHEDRWLYIGTGTGPTP